MRIEQLGKVSAFVALFVPLGAVGAIRLLGEGAQVSVAAIAEPVPELPVFEPLRPGVGFEAESISDPFWRERAVATNEFPDEFIEDGEQQVERVEAPDFALTAVMPSATRPLAVIDGKPRKIGDVIAPGWELVGIDGNARCVTVRARDGRTFLVRMTRNIP